MAFEQGVATGNTDLLNKLVLFLTTNTDLVSDGQNWTILDDRGVTNGYDAEYYLRAPGLSTTEEIYINIAAFSNPTQSIHSWECRGALGYDQNNQIDQQLITSPAVYAYHTDGNISYTFSGDGQGVVCVADFSGVNVETILTKLLPTGSPGQFPYPLFISACDDSSTGTFSDAIGDFDVSCGMSPGRGSYFYDGQGNWRTVRNRSGSSGGATAPNTGIVVTPTCVDQFFRGTTSNFVLDPVQPNPDGSYTRIPFELLTQGNHPSPNRFGYIPRIEWVTGIGLNAGDALADGGENFLVVKNISRSSWEEFAVVRLS